MKGRLWLNLALLAAVAALALAAHFKPQHTDDEYRLSNLKAADATTVTIENQGAAPIALVRAPQGWRLSAPFAARADEIQVQRLLEILNATAKDRYAASGLARFDLNTPRARVAINGRSFGFGALNPVSGEQYVLTQDGVSLVAARYGAALPAQALQMVSKQLFAADEAPVAFEFPDFRLAQENGRWQLTPAAPDLSQDDLNRWIDDWRLAGALGVQAASQRKPLATIKVRLKNGSDITVAVLQREPRLALARSDEPYEYQFAGATAQRLLTPPAAVAVK
jgi:hypothetical protein